MHEDFKKITQEISLIVEREIWGNPRWQPQGPLAPEPRPASRWRQAEASRRKVQTSQTGQLIPRVSCIAGTSFLRNRNVTEWKTLLPVVLEASPPIPISQSPYLDRHEGSFLESFHLNLRLSPRCCYVSLDARCIAPFRVT